jgi:hypothetical protein
MTEVCSRKPPGFALPIKGTDSQVRLGFMSSKYDGYLLIVIREGARVWLSLKLAATTLWRSQIRK